MIDHDTLVNLAASLHGVAVEEYNLFVEDYTLNRKLAEIRWGKEKSDDLYSCLSFIDGYTKAFHDAARKTLCHDLQVEAYKQGLEDSDNVRVLGLDTVVARFVSKLNQP